MKKPGKLLPGFFSHPSFTRASAGTDHFDPTCVIG